MLARLYARLRSAVLAAFGPRSLGARGEAAAARYLRRRRYLIIARGVKAGGGEIDLIAVDRSGPQRTLVFVEVKTRTSHDAGHPAEAVDRHKQAQLTRLAAAYLKRHELLDCPARFDVVAVTWPAKGSPTIEHIINAFEARDAKNLML